MSGANSTLIQGARIFDGERVIPLGSVLFRGERIVAVGADIALPSGCEVVPGQGRTLLPGLIDAHTHTPTNPAFALRALRHALTFGVTTTLDMGTDPMTAARMKAHAAVHGDIADLRSAEVVATAPGGHPTELGAVLPTLTAPGQAPGFVADRVAEGSDYLKIILEDGWAYGLTQPCLAYPVLAALVREAHAHRLMAVAHVTRQAMARQALAAGVDVLAHTFVDEPPAPDVVEAIAAAGLVVIPTLAVFETAATHELATDPRVAPFMEAEFLARLGERFPTKVRPPSQIDIGTRVVRALHAAGVPILAGTDAPNPATAPGASLHRELRLLAAAGLAPTEALAAATSRPARVFGLSDRGRIAPGLRADLLLVEGDPATDLDAALDIVAVWRGGVRFDREARRRLVATGGVDTT